jgi:hypothetical protein
VCRFEWRAVIIRYTTGVLFFFPQPNINLDRLFSVYPGKEDIELRIFHKAFLCFPRYQNLEKAVECAMIRADHSISDTQEAFVRTLLIQEMLRAMAVGYLVMIILAGFYQQMGWSLALVLALANLAGLLSFTFFTTYRCKTGKELLLCSKRGWLITGAVLVAGLLLYVLVAHLEAIPVSIPFLIAALLILLASIHWDFRRQKHL